MSYRILLLPIRIFLIFTGLILVIFWKIPQLRTPEKSLPIILIDPGLPSLAKSIVLGSTNIVHPDQDPLFWGINHNNPKSWLVYIWDELSKNEQALALKRYGYNENTTFQEFLAKPLPHNIQPFPKFKYDNTRYFFDTVKPYHEPFPEKYIIIICSVLFLSSIIFHHYSIYKTKRRHHAA